MNIIPNNFTHSSIEKKGNSLFYNKDLWLHEIKLEFNIKTLWFCKVLAVMIIGHEAAAMKMPDFVALSLKLMSKTFIY